MKLRPRPAEEAPPAEIPSELLRPINARGSLVFGEVLLGKILFEDINVVLNQKDGRLRLNPMSSKLFGGQYQGDVQLDVSGATPVISVNERIENVGLGPLGQAMLDNDRLSGRIDGVFTLRGTGNDTAEMQKTLNGNVSFTLKDGTYEGTDVWHELRRARAVIRREPPPEPTLPARTRFTEVSATGRVVDGVLNNDDLVAELPFIRLAGRGSVDLVAATLDYTLNGRVFEKPELMGDVTPAELEDFTKVELPIRISGELADPKFGLDFEELVKEKAEEAVKDKLLDLLGGDEPAEGEAGAEDAETDPEEILKDKLRDLLKRD
jgi:AsmA protein